MNKLLFAIPLIFFSACASAPEKKEFNLVNPTSFVFPTNIAELKKVIISGFRDWRFKNMELTYMNSEFNRNRIFNKLGNENDFYLEPSGPSIGKSYIYLNADYRASFHLHLREIDDARTEVIVYTIKARVLVGKEFLPSLPHFVRRTKYLDVVPSTIEEYEILFIIGKSLKQEMPPIKYP